MDEGGDAEPDGEDGVVHGEVGERVREWFVGLFAEQDVVGLDRQDQNPDGGESGVEVPSVWYEPSEGTAAREGDI